MINEAREQDNNSPASGAVFIRRGLVQLQDGDLGGARQAFERALEINPESLTALIGLLRVDLAEERPGDALTRVDAILAIQPDLAEAQSLRGVLLLGQGNFIEALQAFDSALNLRNDAAPALLGRALARLGLDQRQDALSDLRSITLANNNPDSAETRNIIAELIRLIEQDISTEAGPTPGAADALIIIEGREDFSYAGQIGADRLSQRFRFEAEAGEVVGIQMQRQSGDLDPLLVLTDTEGNPLITNDDDPESASRDSYIRGFTIPISGDYEILATRFQQDLGSTTGEYVLNLLRNQPVANNAISSIAFGETLTGEITDTNPELIIEFEVQAGAVIGIEMLTLSGNLDPLVILLDADGARIAINDDDPQGTGRNAYLREFRLPQSGTYQIVATRFQERLGTTTGSFELRLEEIVRSS